MVTGFLLSLAASAGAMAQMPTPGAQSTTTAPVPTTTGSGTTTTRTATTTPAPPVAPVPSSPRPPGRGREGRPKTAGEPVSLSLLRRTEGSLRFGDRVKLTGRHSSRKRDKLIRVEYKARGEKPKTIAKARTDKKGRYVVRHRPAHTGRYRALDRKGELKTDKIDVEVKPKLDFEVEPSTLTGRKVDASGELLPGGKGRRILVEARRKGDWKKVEKVDAGKPFEVSWRPERVGSYKLRASFEGDKRNLGEREAAPVMAFRESVTSIYGPGFYGRKTACGQTLERKTVGVAHKKIACGKKVTFQRKGRSITVPVIDRGPFVKGREWDLTTAAAAKLKVEGVQRVWSSR